jgi:hypothetical protein
MRFDKYYTELETVRTLSDCAAGATNTATDGAISCSGKASQPPNILVNNKRFISRHEILERMLHKGFFAV